MDGLKSPGGGLGFGFAGRKGPYFQIYSEAGSQEEADLLASAYMERIGAFREE